MKKRYSTIITLGSLAGLLIGFGLGLGLKSCDSLQCKSLIAYSDLFGKAWVLGLFFFALPLVFAFTFSSILSMSNSKKAGRIGFKALFLHVLIYSLGTAVAVALSYLFLHLFREKIPVLADVSSIAGFVEPKSESNLSALIGQTEGVVAALRFLGNIFLYLFAGVIVIALILTRLDSNRKLFLQNASIEFAQKILQFFKIFLLSMPVGILLLIFPLAAKTGIEAVFVSVWFILLVCILLILYTGVLHLFVHIWGSIPIVSFIKAMFPSNLIAMSTRSSIATIPALMHAADQKLKLPATVAAMIIPFFVTVFRLNSCISSPAALIFLAYVFNIPITPYGLATFCIACLFLTFGSPGIPSGSKNSSMPLFLALGIPIEGFFLIKMIDTIPDILKTNLNVTHTMTLTTIIAKGEDLSKLGNSTLPENHLEIE